MSYVVVVCLLLVVRISVWLVLVLVDVLVRKCVIENGMCCVGWLCVLSSWFVVLVWL